MINSGLIVEHTLAITHYISKWHTTLDSIACVDINNYLL